MTHEEGSLDDMRRESPEPNSLDDFMQRIANVAEEGERYGLSFVVVGLSDDPFSKSEALTTLHISAGPVKAAGMLTVALRRFVEM